MFELFRDCHGPLIDLKEDRLPTVFSAWCDRSLALEMDATHFGYVYHGDTTLECDAGCFPLKRGMYFSVPDRVALSGTGRGFVASRIGYRGFFQIGGPIEEQGRLRYIDGCTDSLLIAPVLLGDPCLNLLHFPPHINQTMHTHPSMRLGMVSSGRGTCILADRETRLEPGVAFNIPAETVHAFRTEAHPMTVIAYHPDSDFGPAHENHPMINRTMVDGLSARYLDGIRTQL